MKQRVVIIGKGYNNRLALLRSLGEFGYEISIVVLEHKKKPIDSYSKYVTNCYLCPKQTEEDLISVLMTNCVDEKQKVILIPSNDFSVHVLDNNYDKLSKFFLFPNIGGKQGEVVKWMDKVKQKELAWKMGFNVANSKSVKIVNGHYLLPTEIVYPCFTKTQSFVLNSKKVLHKCDNENELKKRLDYICTSHKDMDVIIEDFKNIEKEYAVVGFTNNREVIIPGVIEITTISDGVAKTGMIVPIDNYIEIINKIKAYILEIGFVGIFDVDLYMSNGQLYFGELNFRYGGSGFAFCKKGINFSLMLVKTFSGDNLDTMKKEITCSSTFANELVCLINWYCGNMTTKEFWHAFNHSDIVLIKDECDPVPEQRFIKYYKKIRIKRLLRMLIIFLKKIEYLFRKILMQKTIIEHK